MIVQPQHHGIFRQAHDHPAFLRLLRLDHGELQHAVVALGLLDLQVAGQRQRLLDQERRRRPADRPLAEILGGRIPHRHLRAVGHDLELRRRVVFEAHAPRTAHVECAVHDRAVGIALDEPRLQRADRIDVPLDFGRGRLALGHVLGTGRRGNEDRCEGQKEDGKEDTHGSHMTAEYGGIKLTALFPRR